MIFVSVPRIDVNLKIKGFVFDGLMRARVQIGVEQRRKHSEQEKPQGHYPAVPPPLGV